MSPQISGVTPETPQFLGIDPNFLGLKMCYPKHFGVTPDLPQISGVQVIPEPPQISGVTPDLPQNTPDFLGQPQKHPKNPQVPLIAINSQ